MAAFIPIIIWIVSAIICHYIAHARNIKSNFVRRLIVVFLGPLAIPLALLIKPEKTIDIS